MNPAPLPQPSPHTCTNCGASLTTLPALCPQCKTMVHEFQFSMRRRRPTPRQYLLTLALSLAWLLIGCALIPQLIVGSNGPTRFNDLGMDMIGFLLFMIAGPIACYLLIVRRSTPK